MRFRIYNVAAGGSALWTETKLVSAGQGVDITAGGLFSTQLGSVVSLPPSIFNTGSALYLEVELPTPATATGSSPSWTEGAMTPRNPVVSSPFAINSAFLNGKSDTDFAPASGSTNYIQNQSATPQNASFNIQGNGTVGGSLTVGGTLTANNGLTVVGSINATASSLNLSSTSANALRIQSAGNNLFNIDAVGHNVQIGSIGGAAPLVLLTLDSVSFTGAEPATSNNGAMYYSNEKKKFRCYQDGSWQDCIGSNVIDWTDISLTSVASTGSPGKGIHRVRRLSTGQIELQLDVALNTSTAGSTVATLPAWAIPSVDMRFSPAVPSATVVFNAHMDILSDKINIYATNISSLAWVGLNIVYTP